MRQFGLRDDQWERIRDLLPGREGSVGVTAADNRLFVEAVLYRYRIGMPRRDLPERFGDWKNVHRRFSRSRTSSPRSTVQRDRRELREDRAQLSGCRQLVASAVWLNLRQPLVSLSMICQNL
jgi:transposase